LPLYLWPLSTPPINQQFRSNGPISKVAKKILDLNRLNS
jgi:hypothetical protein